ncbi:MAG: hypothetical protein M0Z66_14670 [Thermaerobacter sp.]|nr:hypothetical protein [Thermaerobacter sp.]
MANLPQSVLGVAYLAVLLPVLFVVAIPAIIIVVLYFRHRERMAYLSRPPYPQAADAASSVGDAPPQVPPYAYDDPYRYPPYRNRYDPSLYHPLARVGRLIGIGFGIALGLLPLGVGPLLLAGLIPLFVGLIRLGELYLAVPAAPPTAHDLDVWLHRSLWSGGIGLALLLGLWTLGPSPLLLFGSVPFGYGLGLLLSYFLATRAP